MGIPAIIRVTHFVKVRGSYSYNAPSDMDYHGYTDSEWEVLDTRGRPADWLERKITDAERDRIESLIQEEMIPA
jgi:hypothetical protein